ncbi:MAG: hypothetical protein A2W19_08985 [Spirochaetes bacterium RBG_16_49_21]|nr:MAG: hypothetical protein A2W19_08985 [Spirochaetes bacterium RBG_16_49_21]
MQSKQKYVLVEYRCELYLPGISYRHNWAQIEGKNLLVVKNTGKEYLINELEKLLGKGHRDIEITKMAELSRAQYLRLKAKGKWRQSYKDLI